VCNSKKPRRILRVSGLWAYVCQPTGLGSIELSNLIYLGAKIFICSKRAEKEDEFFSQIICR